MPVSSKLSCLLASLFGILVFAGMQLYRTQLAASQPLTIIGGSIGSLLFILILTAVGNLETSLFGKNFQAQLFPEVVLCLLVACLASGLVHRVCVTTCIMFSLVALYYINKISASNQSTTAPVPAGPLHKQKK